MRRLARGGGWAGTVSSAAPSALSRSKPPH